MKDLEYESTYLPTTIDSSIKFSHCGTCDRMQPWPQVRSPWKEQVPGVRPRYGHHSQFIAAHQEKSENAHPTCNQDVSREQTVYPFDLHGAIKSSAREKEIPGLWLPFAVCAIGYVLFKSLHSLKSGKQD